MKKPVAVILIAVLAMFFAFGVLSEADSTSGLKQLFSFASKPFDSSVWKNVTDAIDKDSGSRLRSVTFHFHPDSEAATYLGFGKPAESEAAHHDPKEIMSAEKDEESGYDYLLYLPKDYQASGAKSPLIISLHGITSHGNDPMKLANDGLPKHVLTRDYFPAVMAAPLCREDSHWVEDEHGNEDMHEIDKLKIFVKSMTDRYNIDPKRVYVTGYSMGGRAAWKLACAMPDTFAAVIPICGRADAYDLNTLANTPVWLFHGALDDIVSLDYEINTIKRFVEMKHPDFHVTIFPKNDHNAWTDAYRMPELWEFILNSVRK